jgi:hypothetical protein
MKTALAISLLILMLAAAVGILVVVSDVHQVSRRATEDLAEVGATLRAGHDTVNKFNALADSDKQSWEQTSRNSADITLDLRRLVAHADRVMTRVNTTTLNQFDAQIQANGDSLQLATRNLGETAAKLGKTADGVTAVTGSLNARINDPAIDNTLRAFNQAAQNLSATTAHMSVATSTGVATMGRVDHVAAYYEKKLTTPAGFFKTFFYTGLDLASKGANVITAIK